MNLLDKRQFLGGLGVAVIGASTSATARENRGEVFEKSLVEIEESLNGRLGVALLDTQDGFRAGHRVGERFPFCSTFKFLAVAAVLARVDAGKDRLDGRIVIEAKDLVAHSPALEKHVNGAMPLAELCEVALTLSDNAAANLLLASLGGPSELTQFLRDSGDQCTRLDRWETALNEAAPGDPRDTTTPAAMVMHLRKFVLGDGLSPESRRRLTSWLVANQTGDACLRAGAPGGWRVGDKTGSGERGTRNDIAVLWPPDRAPLVVAAYLTGAEAPLEQRNAALASVARAVAKAVAA